MDADGRRRSTAVLVSCAAGAAGCVWLLKQLASPAQQHSATDFETFLLAPPPPPTAQPPRQQPAVSATCFESFLKVAPAAAQPCSTDFASFLIDGGSSSSAAAATGAADPAAEPQEAVPEDAVPVAVLYGTEYGFAHEIAEKLAAQLKDTGKFW
jgi:sulfite reductase alpha subunit-like flavoprotein